MSRVRRGVLAALVTVAALAVDATAGATPGRAVAASAAAPRAAAGRAAHANAPALAARLPAVAPRAPVAPALPTSPTGGEGDEQNGSGSPAGEADPLVANGLGSPSCRSSGTLQTLGAGERRDCQTSGFIGSAAPTGNYGIDVHIDTGVLGLSSGGLLSAVQDLVLTPIWMAIVWVLHALVVMLEWSFSLDLLASNAGSLRTDLVREQSGVTAPWLPLVLALAALLLAYRGLVQRRVADSLGETLAMALMIAGGLWLILDPAGTVGAVGRWADDAGLGTLAVAAQGSPVAPGRALGSSMSALFATAVEAPWCYLEFGDVGWCKEPGRLDPRLRTSGLKIAARELREAGCGTGESCTGNGAARAVQTSAQLLREARTNGALFLALPANGPARNSINDGWSLLRVLCQSEEATNCRGQTAAQAQFRTNGGTWSRVGGLLLIAIGMLGLILLLGHLALRLLTAAVLSLLYLLIAPGVVLAPALGERGRELFRAWAARLFGATVAKLVYAFLLGVVLTLMSLLGGLEGLGWWAQWLLMSAFWWSAFLHRHQLRAVASGALSSSGSPARRPGARRLAESYGIAPGVRRLRARNRVKPAPEMGRGEQSAGVLPGASIEGVAAPGDGHGAGNEGHVRDGGPSREPDAPGGPPLAGDPRAAAPPPPAEPGWPEAPWPGVPGPEAPEPGAPGPNAWRSPAGAGRGPDRYGRTGAPAPGAAEAASQHAAAEQQRLAQLARIDDALAAAQRSGDLRRSALLQARRTRLAAVAQAHSGGLSAPARDRAVSPAFLAAQAALPARGARTPSGGRRDYAALAQLVGFSSAQYEQLSPPRARAARLEMDRELAARHAAAPPVNEIWDDVRAVSEGRKRQLGIGRP
ncbi:MAG: hypothetical protein ACYDC2_11460 [Solirubrobacteraceae bacterium]